MGTVFWYSMRSLLFYIFILILPFGFSQVHSQERSIDFQSDYEVQYLLKQDGGKIDTHAKFTIKVTNLRTDIFVKKFSISFPKTFQIHNITASDDHGSIQPQVDSNDSLVRINLEFSNPQTGKSSENFFFLEFDQDNLFKVNGNVWEVMLPTIDNKTNGVYKVVVNLPPGSNKKISVAKPKPTFIKTDEVVWQNPSTRTILAVFGDKQYYDLNLNYNLENPKFTPVYTEIALIPDTLYQKTYLTTLQPPPQSVRTDADGNIIARYDLNPHEKKVVNYQGVVELSTQYRDEVKQAAAYLFEQQKRYLMTTQKYWEIKNYDKISSLKTPSQAYSFVTNNLHYNYQKLALNNKRLGADMVLNNPTQAVCTEFADLFVAIGRENGFYTREIEGYGYDNDPQLRPLSLTSDILHAWPEYYDTTQQLWIPVDPTWENTSGIDYFNSFDLNHVTFAIHGQKSDYPYPAGTYKTENSKDISMKPVTNPPDEKRSIVVSDLDLPKQINDSSSYQGKVVIQNSGNVTEWNIPVSLKTNNILSSFTNTTIPMLVPLERKEVMFDYHAAQKNTKSNAVLTMQVGTKTVQAETTVVPYAFDIGVKIAYGVLGFCVVFGVIMVIKKRK